jgi:hypothetical protein
MATALAIAPVLFNPAALMLLFEGTDATALSNCTCLHLAIEGILVPNDFNNFDDDGLDAIYTNLANPPKVQAIRPDDIQAGRLLEIMAFEVSAKSKVHLKGAKKDRQVLREHRLDLGPRHHDLGCHQAVPGAVESINGA